MTIGVDIDSVIAYLEGPLMKFHNDNYGTNLRVDDITNYDLTHWWKCTPNELTERLFEFYRSPQMSKLPPVEGSQKGISQLKKNHDLVAITARPLWLDEETNRWLDTNFPDSFTKVIHTNQVSKSGESKKKSEVCKEVGATYILEDHILYANDCAENGINVCLLERPWNAKEKLHENITRVSSWDEIVNLF
jgi:uncharacterized HAD superfamily protein